VAFDSTTGEIYVTNAGSNSVSVISGSTKSVIDTINVGANPDGIAFDSINGDIYVANGGSNTVSIIDGSGVPPLLSSIPEFPFSFNLVIIFVVAVTVYIAIRQKMTINFK